MDKENRGVMTLEEAMQILYLRHGRANLDQQLEKLFGTSDLRSGKVLTLREFLHALHSQQVRRRTDPHSNSTAHSVGWGGLHGSRSCSGSLWLELVHPGTCSSAVPREIGVIRQMQTALCHCNTHMLSYECRSQSCETAKSTPRATRRHHRWPEARGVTQTEPGHAGFLKQALIRGCGAAPADITSRAS